MELYLEAKYEFIYRVERLYENSIRPVVLREVCVLSSAGGEHEAGAQFTARDKWRQKPQLES